MEYTSLTKKGSQKEIKGDYTPVGGFYSKKEKFKKEIMNFMKLSSKRNGYLCILMDIMINLGVRK